MTSVQVCGWEEIKAPVKWEGWRKSDQSYFWESEKNGASIEQMGYIYTPKKNHETIINRSGSLKNYVTSIFDKKYFMSKLCYSFVKKSRRDVVFWSLLIF